jgi:hypothetical protein
MISKCTTGCPIVRPFLADVSTSTALDRCEPRRRRPIRLDAITIGTVVVKNNL